MEFKFKIGDRVKLPKQKSIRVKLPKQKSIGVSLEDSFEYKKAVKNNQDYMCITDILKDDEEFGDCYVVSHEFYADDGDFFAEEDLELYEEKINVSIESCHKNAVLPTYAKKGDAGMDIYSVEDIIIPAGETKIIPTGLKVAIPEGYEIQIRPRSGLSFKTPLRIPNAPGTIDAGYRDEIGIIITNTDQNSDFTVEKSTRIAQMVLQKVPKINWEVTDNVANIGINRGGGFGSTGTK